MLHKEMAYPSAKVACTVASISGYVVILLQIMQPKPLAYEKSQWQQAKSVTPQGIRPQD